MAMSLAAGSSDVESDSSAGGVGGRVSRLREGWRVHEDEALAQRLQTEEITAHYGGNRTRNHQIRTVDLPTAREQQMQEADQAEVERLQRRNLEFQDAEMAQQLQLRDEEAYTHERDLVFAKRLQQMELSRGQPKVPLPRGSAGAVSRRPPPRVPREPPPPPSTPPLPVNALGDVPETPGTTDDDVLPHVRNGVKYNDEQYLVKLARPADVIAEPLYANNKPEHYAVSNANAAALLQDTEGGAAGGRCPSPLPNDKMPTLLLGAAGLSQKDVALSRRAEEQLEQERRDAELAARLQEEEEEGAAAASPEPMHHSADFQYALELQERERAKLKRAKERAKEKRRLKKLHEQQQQATAESPPTPPPPTTAAETERVSGDEEGEERRWHRTPPARPPETSPSNLKPPSRRPYLNPDAIEAHQSECTPDSEEDDDDPVPSTEQAQVEGCDEPEYANVGAGCSPQVINLHQDSFGQVTKVRNTDGGIIPPYMPLQQQTTKKSQSLEKRIKRKKEKEGCKQQ